MPDLKPALATIAQRQCASKPCWRLGFDSLLSLKNLCAMKSKKIEEKSASTILQEAERVQVGNRFYEIKPVSVGTVIQVSRLIARLPKVKLDTDNNSEIVMGTLMIAKDCEILGEIASTLMVGVEDKSSLLYFVRKLFQRTNEIKIKKLSSQLLSELTAKQLNTLVIAFFSKMEISDFFGLTTSLLEVNLLRETKGVV